MSTVIVKGVVRNGRVELTAPLNLPDGVEVAGWAGSLRVGGYWAWTGLVLERRTG